VIKKKIQYGLLWGVHKYRLYPTTHSGSFLLTPINLPLLPEQEYNGMSGHLLRIIRLPLAALIFSTPPDCSKPLSLASCLSVDEVKREIFNLNASSHYSQKLMDKGRNDTVHGAFKYS
jgi:hypothetical protein